MKTIGIIGSGVVGQSLADGFLKHGYEVMIGSRDGSKLDQWKTKTGDKGKTGTLEETAKFGDIIVLAVKGSAAEEAIKLAGINNLNSKTVVDTTNPISNEPPVNGVIKYFTDINYSLMERLQKLAPEANFVKSFSCVGNTLMVNPQLKGGKPTMFICGNNKNAKAEVSEILNKFGWEIADYGAAEAARAIEPLAMLWCIPGFLNNDWIHALKMLTV
jgi:predicted dinucleotide-binding enzyme